MMIKLKAAKKKSNEPSLKYVTNYILALRNLYIGFVSVSIRELYSKKKLTKNIININKT